MGHRAYSRHGNGRFRRATLENTFGLSAPTCPECNRFNPHAVNEPPPENCHACGAPMKPEHAEGQTQDDDYRPENIPWSTASDPLPPKETPGGNR